MANKIKGAGLYQDRDHMGKLPMAQKVTEYFPQQYNPYNSDNYYAGDVADGTAQRMGDAPLSQQSKSKHMLVGPDGLGEDGKPKPLVAKSKHMLVGPDGLDKKGNPKPLVASALRKGVNDAETDRDGRAIDANKPQAQMKEGGAKQVAPGHRDFDVLKHLEERRPGPGMRYDVVPSKENPITPGVGNTSLSPTSGKGGDGGNEKTSDLSESDKPVKNKPIKPVINKNPYKSKYLKTGLFGKGSHRKSVRRTHSISGKRWG